MGDANKISEHEGVLSYSVYSVNLGRLSAGQHTVVISAKGSGYYGDLKLTQDISLASNYSIVDAGAKTKLVSSSVSINFVVDEARPTTPPEVTLLSPTNTTYYYIRDWTHVPYIRLEYEAEDTRLSVGYSFDDDSNITPAVNGTKLDIPIRSRSLTFYANDSFGNSATPQTVYYEIQRYIEPTPQDRTPPNTSFPQASPNDSQTIPSEPYEEPQPTENEIVTGAAIATAVIAAGLGFLLYLIKRK
jgi:hypothetical protein